MLAIFINLISIIFSIWIVFSYLKKGNNIIAYFFLFSLFFVIIPLLTDSLGLYFLGQDYIDLILKNNSTLYNVYYTDSENNLSFSFFVLMFNLLFFLSFKLFTFKLNYQMNQIKYQTFYPTFYYIIIGFASVILFVFCIHSSFLKLPLFLVLFNFCSIGYTVGLIPILKKKQYLNFIIFCLPSLFLGIETGNRALFLPLFLTLFYFLLDDFEIKKNIIFKVIYILLFVLLTIPILNFFRKGSFYISYPIWRDVCLGDGYFCFSNLIPHEFASNIIRLIQTGLPYVILKDSNYYDITLLIADTRFSIGWGSLHPTAYGWLFVDLGWYGIFSSIYFAFFLSLLEYFKFIFQKNKLVSMIISFELIFCAIFVRGSVQYAYSTIIYPIIIITFISIIIYLNRIFNKRIINKCYTE